MKRITATMLVLSAACATTPAPKPATTPQPSATPAAASAEDLVDHLGDSTQTAVAVPADAPNDGVDFENNWIFDRYGRFRRVKYAIAHDDQRRYDVITVELTDGSLHAVYFDITELWLNWTPSSPK